MLSIAKAVPFTCAKRAVFTDYIYSMVETLLSGIVLGLIPVTLSGLFVTAYLQYRRGDQLNL
jgi:cytochrome b6-f complex subunit 5